MGNLRGMVRQIFLKIREQLEDEDHPIVWLIARFQEAFTNDIQAQLGEINQMSEDLPSSSSHKLSFKALPPALALSFEGRLQYQRVDENDPLYAINRGNSLRSQSEQGHDVYNSMREQTPMQHQEIASSPNPDLAVRLSRRTSTAVRDINADRSIDVMVEEPRGTHHNHREDRKEQTHVEVAMQDMVEQALREVEQFLIIMYGCCVRFYSTVVDWEIIQRMSEDLIERMTSKLFENAEFAELVVQLCGELTREQD